jgi:HD-GYP domain-containing protein (c-di-GMP phosphodiesterase class II)
MKRKGLSEIVTGEKAALDVYDYAGKQLVLKGVKLTAAGIEKLKFHGIPCVYTEDKKVKVNTVFETALMAELLRVTWNFAESGGKNSSILKVYGVDEIKRFAAYNSEPAAKMAYGHIFRYFAGRLIKNMKNLCGIYYDFLDYRSTKTYLYYHVVNSACISLIIGNKMGLKEKELTDLCVGTLLFDLKMKVYDFAGERRRLTDTEKEELKQHVFLSCEEARNTYGVPSAAAVVAGQHHERVDGSGYPKRLKGESIHLLSRVAAIADVYDALISERPHRKAYHSDEAWEYIMSNKGILFDESAADAFGDTVAKYLPGDRLALNDGREAFVMENTAGNMKKPIIKIIEKTNKSDIISDTAIDLSKQNVITVVKVVKSAGREGY